MYGSEKVLPYNQKEHKGVQVRRMFDAIAGKYDVLNHTLSFGFDKGWRRRGIRFLRPFAPKQILDIATGTGDLAMVARAGLQDHIFFEQQDCTALTYADDSFDAVTAAFGVRNFEDIERGLSEMYRVLKPGGHLMILELSTPEHFPMKQLYSIYSRVVIPNIGRLISKEKAAYSYLPASIKVVPQGKVMEGLLSRVGFKEAKAHTLTFGICSLYTGSK